MCRRCRSTPRARSSACRRARRSRRRCASWRRTRSAGMTTLNMPDVGESVTEGTVTRWIKHEGDAVQLDDPVVEIETEKVTVEVPSPFEGRLTRILVQEGDVVPVGAPLAEFDVGAEAEPAANNKQQ